MSLTAFTARVPLALDCPPAMASAVAYVLDGEYESHLDGEGLDILDIGANVGSFARWADLRWPKSRIRCFEPNPGTFAYLTRNTGHMANVMCVNAALYPGLGARAAFFSRYAGDGEAGLETYARDTFIEAAASQKLEVDVVDPARLPSAEIVKIDIEGGEGEVLAHLDLSRTVLVLAEFQNRVNRERIRALLETEFHADLDEECPWDPILDYRDYRADLKGDVYGRMFYVRKGQTRLTRSPR